MYLFSEKVPERKGKVIMRILEGAYTEALIFTDNIVCIGSDTAAMRL